MKGGAFGFSRRELIWFAAIILATLVIGVFCLFRIIHKFYNNSEENGTRIRQLSSEVLQLQEMNMHAVNIQRSSLNLIIYANNKEELASIDQGIDRNRDSLARKLAEFGGREILPAEMTKEIAATGPDYLVANREYREMLRDSLRKGLAADFNVNKMRPALRKFTDLMRKASTTLTSDIQKSVDLRLNLFTLVEFWILVLLALPYLYFFYRFVRLFIKVLMMDTKV